MADIRIITEPTVRLVVRPELDGEALAGWLDQEYPDRPQELRLGHTVPPGADCDYYLDGHDGEAIPEIAGRLCYGFSRPRPGGTAAYHQHIREAGHGSILSHAVYGFVFSGISRSCTHEWIRHSVGVGISEESQRFVECPGAFVLPPALIADLPGYERFKARASAASETDHRSWDRVLVWADSCKGIYHSYNRLTKSLAEDAPAELTGTERRKWARQAARSVLPECTATRMFWSCNLRSGRHIVESRASRHADAEIRRLACMVYELLVAECPAVFADYERVELASGGYELVTKTRKV